LTERCFVSLEFDEATTGGQARRAIAGYLSYLQRRELHFDPKPHNSKPDVVGLVNYVAHRDRASSRAELFGPGGRVGPRERKEFIDFVADSVEGSKPHLFRTSAGNYMDRRRAVSRYLISPHSADGLDLVRLASAAVKRLEGEIGVDGLRWIAAIHRNTAHHHVHVVLAGMRSNGFGGFMRYDITKPRLAAMQQAITFEIERQRAERSPSRTAAKRIRQVALAQPSAATHQVEANQAPEQAQIPTRRSNDDRGRRLVPLPHNASVIALRAVARRYQLQMERELEDAHRQSQRELAL
jgi:hypothetical protein